MQPQTCRKQRSSTPIQIVTSCCCFCFFSNPSFTSVNARAPPSPSPHKKLKSNTGGGQELLWKRYLRSSSRCGSSCCCCSKGARGAIKSGSLCPSCCHYCLSCHTAKLNESVTVAQQAFTTAMLQCTPPTQPRIIRNPITHQTKRCRHRRCKFVVLPSRLPVRWFSHFLDFGVGGAGRVSRCFLFVM